MLRYADSLNEQAVKQEEDKEEEEGQSEEMAKCNMSN